MSKNAVIDEWLTLTAKGMGCAKAGRTYGQKPFYALTWQARVREMVCYALEDL